MKARITDVVLIVFVLSGRLNREVIRDVLC